MAAHPVCCDASNTQAVVRHASRLRCVRCCLTLPVSWSLVSCVQGVHDALTASRLYISKNAQNERQLQQMSPAPLVKQLQQQADGLARALVALASATEADATRISVMEVRKAGVCATVSCRHGYSYGGDDTP